MFFDLIDTLPYVTYSFSRPFQESDGFYSVEKDGKIIVTVNALGINEGDIDVQVETDPANTNKQFLVVKGKTHNEILDKEGIELTIKSFITTFEKHNITKVDTNCEFDPNVHNAVMQVDSPDHETGQIVQELQKGYEFFYEKITTF